MKLHHRQSFIEQMQIQLQQYEEQKNRRLEQRTFYRNRIEKENKAKQALIYIQQTDHPVVDSTDNIEGWYNPKHPHKRQKQCFIGPLSNSDRNGYSSSNVSTNNSIGRVKLYEEHIIPELKVLLSKYESPKKNKKTSYQFSKSSSTTRALQKPKKLKTKEDEIPFFQISKDMQDKDSTIDYIKSKNKYRTDIFKEHNTLPYYGFPETENTEPYPYIQHNFTNSKRSIHQKSGRRHREGKVTNEKQLLNEFITHSAKQSIRDQFTEQYGKPNKNRQFFILNNLLQ